MDHHGIWAADNGLTATGGSAIALGLQGNRHLQHLFLEGNYINAAGAVALAGLFKLGPPLRTIVLSGNPVGGLGAQAFADGMRLSRSLRRLNLSGEWDSRAFAASLWVTDAADARLPRRLGCCLDAAGCAAVAMALAHTAMTELDLRDNTWVAENPGHSILSDPRIRI